MMRRIPAAALHDRLRLTGALRAQETGDAAHKGSGVVRMHRLIVRLVLSVAVLTLSACGAGVGTGGSPLLRSEAASMAGATASAASSQVANPCDALSGELPEIPVGSTCWIDTDADDSTSLRAEFAITAPGWHLFIGPAKNVQDESGHQRANVLFAEVTNLTVDACAEQVAADPPIGPTVDDLAEGLAALPPFEVISPPTDTTAFGYSGKHLEIRVPLDQPSTGSEMFSGCGDRHPDLLASWIGPPLSFAYNGYVAPGDTQEFWILDVEGTRLVISALTTANASAELVAERQAILDSVAVVP